MTPKKALGQKLKARREHLKLTQQEVADALTIGRVGYALYESGKNAVAATDLPKLSEVLQVPIGYFFDEEDPGRYAGSEHGRFEERSGSPGDMDKRLTGIEDQLRELLERFKQVDDKKM